MYIYIYIYTHVIIFPMKSNTSYITEVVITLVVDFVEAVVRVFLKGDIPRTAAAAVQCNTR